MHENGLVRHISLEGKSWRCSHHRPMASSLETRIASAFQCAAHVQPMLVHKLLSASTLDPLARDLPVLLLTPSNLSCPSSVALSMQSVPMSTSRAKTCIGPQDTSPQHNASVVHMMEAVVTNKTALARHAGGFLQRLIDWWSDIEDFAGLPLALPLPVPLPR